jgi:hypothetical protein
MDLWSALGVSRQAGLIAAAVGLVAALVLAGSLAFRKGSGDDDAGLGLGGR